VEFDSVKFKLSNFQAGYFKFKHINWNDMGGGNHIYNTIVRLYVLSSSIRIKLELLLGLIHTPPVPLSRNSGPVDPRL